MNRFLLAVMALLLILAFIGYTSLSDTFTIYRSELVTVAENVGIIMMLVNGTFIDTRLFKIALFIVGLIVLGVILKILHMQGADGLLLYPFILLFCLYLVHFINKKSKRRIDILKVVTLVSFLVLPPLIVLHIISEEIREVFVLISHTLFWLTFLDFLYTSRKEGVLLNK
jgi:hypothetical protein